MTKQFRGFARMSPERHKEASAKGGRKCPDKARVFSRDTDFAVQMGRKGGLNKPEKREAK